MKKILLALWLASYLVPAAVGVGFLIGYKWISRKNILFEIGAGLGRSFTEDDYLLGYGKLHMGYRFGKKVSGPTKPQSQNY